jgi:hypothetical protein
MRCAARPDYLCPTGAEFRFGIINHNFIPPRWLGTCAEFHAAQFIRVVYVFSQRHLIS